MNSTLIDFPLYSNIDVNLKSEHTCYIELRSYFISTDSLCSFRYLSCGAWAGKLFCLVMIVGFVLWQLLELWQVGWWY